MVAVVVPLWYLFHMGDEPQRKQIKLWINAALYRGILAWGKERGLRPSQIVELLVREGFRVVQERENTER